MPLCIYVYMYACSGIPIGRAYGESAPGRQRPVRQTEGYNYLLILVFGLMLHLYVIQKLFIRKFIRFNFGAQNMSHYYERHHKAYYGDRTIRRRTIRRRTICRKI